MLDGLTSVDNNKYPFFVCLFFSVGGDNLVHLMVDPIETLLEVFAW